MGAYSSTHLTPEEIEELVTQTHFNSKEIEQLYHRFKKLDRSRSGVISRQDLQLISELSLNPMAPRILTMFQSSSGEDAVNAGGVTFDIFVKTLDFFHPATPLNVKLEQLFRAYDVDGDGLISERDLQQILKYYCGPHLTEATCRVLVRRTMQHALTRCKPNGKCVAPTRDEESRGLSFDDFTRVVTLDGLDALNVHVPIQSN